jgi:hypothetical protein
MVVKWVASEPEMRKGVYVLQLQAANLISRDQTRSALRRLGVFEYLGIEEKDVD